MVPSLRRVVTFYSPDNPAAQQSIKITRDAASRLEVGLIERRVTSVDELRAGLRALRPGEADAFFYVSDAMVSSQAELIIETARAKRLPTMLQDRILFGADPGDLPVEQLDRLYFIINLKTAKFLGLTIPQSVLARADEVIQ